MPMPMMPPASTLPTVAPLKCGVIFTEASLKPSLVQVTTRSFFVLCTVALPGVSRYQGHWVFTSEQCAPAAGGDVTATDCVVPSMMLAQPDKAAPSAATAAIAAYFMIAPSKRPQ